MSAQDSRDMRLQIYDSQNTPIPVGGLRTKTLEFFASPLDATHTESPNGWRELLGGAGIKAVEIIADGVFVGSAADALIRAHFFAQSLARLDIVWPGFGTLEGRFLIKALSYQGRLPDEARFEINLSSGGEIQFTPL